MNTKREIEKKIKSAVVNFEKGLACESKNNPKKLFAYVNKNKPVKRSISVIKDTSGVLHTDKSKISNIFNEYFSSVFVK